MANFRAYWLVALTAMACSLFAAPPASTNLVFDAISKDFTAKTGERYAEFDFSLTNAGPADITINSVRASCGCTTPKLPALPWKLAPNESGSFHVTVDLAGKIGTFQKSVYMDTTDGPKLVYVKVILPIVEGTMANTAGVDGRTRNMQIAHADPQAVFRGDCANCHAKTTVGKKGEQLFTAACAICHESEQRAILVPDLHALKQPPTKAYWDAWIRNGKVGSMMPAFALDKHGPLSDEQIDSLTDYLMSDFKTRKPHAPDLSMVSASATTANVPTLTMNGRVVPPGPTSAPRQAAVAPAPHIDLPGSGPLLPPVPPAPSSGGGPVPPSK